MRRVEIQNSRLPHDALGSLGAIHSDSSIADFASLGLSCTQSAGSNVPEGEAMRSRCCIPSQRVGSKEISVHRPATRRTCICMHRGSSPRLKHPSPVTPTATAAPSNIRNGWLPSIGSTAMRPDHARCKAHCRLWCGHTPRYEAAHDRHCRTAEYVREWLRLGSK